MFVCDFNKALPGNVRDASLVSTQTHTHTHTQTDSF